MERRSTKQTPMPPLGSGRNKNKMPTKTKSFNPASIWRNSHKIGRAASPLYIARFEGGELDGRQQAMYGRSRSLPWPHIDKATHVRNELGEFTRIPDFYVCTTPNKRVETYGETRIYRQEPSYELNLK